MLSVTEARDRILSHFQTTPVEPLPLGKCANRVLAVDNLLLLLLVFPLIKALHELGHAAASAFLERIRTSPRIVRVYSTEAIEAEAQAMLGTYHDHDFSYVDAVSFTIMKRQKIRKAFAFDKHFLTAGFLIAP